MNTLSKLYKETRKMKLIKIVQRKREKGYGDWERIMGGMTLVQVHCMHVWKYHTENHLYN
jgi:hypothetical protein